MASGSEALDVVAGALRAASGIVGGHAAQVASSVGSLSGSVELWGVAAAAVHAALGGIAAHSASDFGRYRRRWWWRPAGLRRWRKPIARRWRRSSPLRCFSCGGRRGAADTIAYRGI
ncbi:hypothetical protein [Mycobacterium riyadhense]|uniref:hypothetical protein n=1 Tax=Mycobacterium riyadhense TaxID=486698 RepID=UPI00111BE577|nr:hypothetical protein [Mycobacterium riyadhense]MCV7144632.1 hypothetical protein [Mycobacterium riyadhense]